jgi:hypothetical protein
VAEGRLHPRPHRRPVPRHRRRPRARQEVQARHRSGGRPPRRPRRHRDAPRRLARTGAEARRRPRLSRPRRSSPPLRPGEKPASLRAKSRSARRRTCLDFARHERGGGQGACSATTPLPAASSSPKSSPARSPASPSPRSSRASSPSTPPRAPARPATASARSSSSIPSSSSPTRISIKKGAVVPWAKSNPPSPYYMQVLGSLARA